MRNSVNFLSMPWRLILDFSRREIEKKYRGSYLGVFWVFLGPFLLLGIYTFVYSYVLQVKLGDQDRLDYIIWLYAGLSIFFFVSDVVTTSPPCIRNSPNYVKKVIFPLKVLVSSKFLSALFPFIINFLLLTVLVLFKQHTFHITLLLIPIVLFPVFLFAYGLAMMLASIGVFVRDIDEVVRPALRVFFYLAPIVYPETLVPEKFRGILWLNPLTSMVEHYRRVVVIGIPPDWEKLALFFFVSLLSVYAGTFLFNKLRPAFADVV